jgi:hypothetical protein
MMKQITLNGHHQTPPQVEGKVKVWLMVKTCL